MDFMFKQLFGNPRRKSITIAFLNDLLNRKGLERIVDVSYENTELTKQELDGKTNRLDVLVSTSNKDRINVEIQLVNQHDMPERTLYYWAKLFTSYLEAGQDYSLLVPTIMISILNYPLFPHETDNFHTIFHIKEDTEHFYWSPHLEFHAIDLSQFMVKWKKYRRGMKENISAEFPWLMMLTAADYRKKIVDKELLQELEVFAMNEHEIREAMIEWENLSANKENKVLYEARLKYLRDQLSNIRGERKAGREEGMKEGLDKGKAEGIRIVAKNLLNSGIPVSEIKKLTGLSEQEIENLKNKI
jgi:predicted transposase/invertase (TIGR01784 family)